MSDTIEFDLTPITEPPSGKFRRRKPDVPFCPEERDVLSNLIELNEARTPGELGNLTLVVATFEHLMKRHYLVLPPEPPKVPRIPLGRRSAALHANGRFKVTRRDLARLMARQGGCCAYCHEPLTGIPHLDHVLPVRRGGRHSIGNLAWSCASCNLRKSAKLPVVFKRERSRG